MSLSEKLNNLASDLEGEFHLDLLHKNIYATDASVYRNLPLAIAYPKHENDLIKLVEFANDHRIGLVPRTAGTSLAGQCVGEGIIVDTSRYFTRILAFDEANATVEVEPGVIRDELNAFLKPFGLFFGPNTSTSNRCMIGGMVGNNSSGTTSIQFGVTRDKVISMNTILFDGSKANFGPLSETQFLEKRRGNRAESKIYSKLYELLSDPANQSEILNEYPKPSIHRRNNGYALDSLLNTNLFDTEKAPANVSKLLCGSEGTLAFTTSITLKLDPLPPSNSVLVAAHFSDIQESMEAVVTTMKHDLHMCELMDKTILDCTRNNREQIKNRFFVEGDPKAILLLEVCHEDAAKADALADDLIEDLKQNNFGYAFPKLIKGDIAKAFELRKAGLGLLGNIVGDRKAVACIEDTAVHVSDLPPFIAEFTEMMKSFGQEAVYYAHAGAGEIHLRPILNLKVSEDVDLFRQITESVARLAKKYKGSMSGEHGDGIVRSEFLELMLGKRNLDMFKEVKKTFDPNGIFNPGKIVDPWKMDERLRYEVDREEPTVETLQDFSDSMGILRAAEKCNGSGDCRKTTQAGGTMCPSYRATRHEKDSTRARANVLREVLTNSDRVNPFDHQELKEVFDLCLSCKACASECPSNVDIAAFKAEFLYQYQKENGISLRTRLFAENAKWNKRASSFPWLANLALNTSLVKRAMGIATQRTVPKLADSTLEKWMAKRNGTATVETNSNKLFLFIDEFTDFYDVQMGKDAVALLEGLGYTVESGPHKESGRSYISKGLLDEAKQLCHENLEYFKDKISKDCPLVGLEPSAILTFRDEYLRLADDKELAKSVAENTLTIEEFIQREAKVGRISSRQFSDKELSIKIHGHCQQKSLSSSSSIYEMLNLPKNYSVTVMATGCCGMAGSFGYEKEHYELSMKVGEESLFPKIRKTPKEVMISAPGTSCRHQIHDGTQRTAYHPVTLLKMALK